jgi:hypothetical protein
MDKKLFYSESRLTGMLLIFSSVIFLVAAIMFTIRFLWELPIGRSPSFFLWERSFVIAALLATLLSFTQLKKVLEAAGDAILASMALVLFLMAAVLAVVAETISFPSDGIVYPPIVAYVILSFLGQAVFGLALLRTGLLPKWIGWVTVAWNLSILVFLIVAKPQDMYYPWLHYVAPLLIGITLLRKEKHDD